MQTPDPSPSPLRRARVITGLALWLLAAPALQALALAGLPVLNFSPGHAWNYLAYGLAAPSVGLLLWRRHPRARFAAYVFLTLEAWRGVHLRHWPAVWLALAWIALLQLPSARRDAPSVRPAEVRARLVRLFQGTSSGPRST
jgi:hypothetical protein